MGHFTLGTVLVLCKFLALSVNTFLDYTVTSGSVAVSGRLSVLEFFVSKFTLGCDASWSIRRLPLLSLRISTSELMMSFTDR